MARSHRFLPNSNFKRAKPIDLPKNAYKYPFSFQFILYAFKLSAILSEIPLLIFLKIFFFFLETNPDFLET